MTRRTTKDGAARAGALAAAAVALGGVLALLRRRRGRAGGEHDGGRRRGPRTFRCECGHELRFAGSGRHSVYWEVGADRRDPILDGRCPQCERALPGQHPRRTQQAAAH